MANDEPISTRMIAKQQFYLIIDTPRGFEALIAAGELPSAGTYTRSSGRYETASATYQLAGSLNRILGCDKHRTIVLVHKSRNPFSAKDMRHVMTAFRTVRFYGEAA